jgi:hypothetical protein
MSIALGTQEWEQEKAFEFLWDASPVLNASRSRILTHVIRYNVSDSPCSPFPCVACMTMHLGMPRTGKK